MKLFIDTHVHAYPSYDFAAMSDAFLRRARHHGAGFGVMMLAQRERMDFPAQFLPDEKAAAIAGRQIACKERVEILALGTEVEFKDGIPAKDAIMQALDVGALPVLAWGIGKWLLSRAKVVDSLLDAFTPAQLAIGDSALRPFFWGEPIPMRRARKAGYTILHGSDPLPRPAEELRAGKYGDILDAPDFDPSKPIAPQVMKLLREGAPRQVGRRAGLFEFIKSVGKA